MRHAADAGLGLLLWGRATACDPHALGGDQCGEQRGPDLGYSTTTRRERLVSHVHGVCIGIC